MHYIELSEIGCQYSNINQIVIMSAQGRKIVVCAVCRQEICVCKEIDELNSTYGHKIIEVCKKCFKHKCICKQKKKDKKPVESEKGSK